MEELKLLILKNHKEWLDGMYSNIEDFANSLDIAESSNEADFRETMFNGANVTWVDYMVISFNGITFNTTFDFSGFSFSVFKNEDVIGTEDWFVELENEYNFDIPWAEFDNQMNEYK